MKDTNGRVPKRSCGGREGLCARGVQGSFWERVTFEQGPEILKGARKSVSWTFFLAGSKPGVFKG